MPHPPLCIRVSRWNLSSESSTTEVIGRHASLTFPWAAGDEAATAAGSACVEREGGGGGCAGVDVEVNGVEERNKIASVVTIRLATHTTERCGWEKMRSQCAWWLPSG